MGAAAGAEVWNRGAEVWNMGIEVWNRRAQKFGIGNRLATLASKPHEFGRLSNC